MIDSPVGFLSTDQIARVHQASLAVLAETGLRVRNDQARRRVAEHGCTVDSATQVVRFPAPVVEEFRAMVPPTFTFHGRDPDYDVTVPDPLPVIATASSAPDLVDPVGGQCRRARADDIARIGHLVNQLEGIDVFSVSTLADDAAPGQFSLSRFYPALKNCVKPCRTSVIDQREIEQVLELGALIAGSREAFMRRPFITFGYCSIVSPLTMDYDSTEMLMYYAEHGLAAYGTVAPMGGLSTPFTLPGMLVLMNAEWLAAAVLAQMSRPGTALLYNFLPVFADLRDGAYAPGAIETGMMTAAVTQMARFYGVPSGGYLGLTNAKCADAQAGFEKGMSPLIGALAGTGFIVMGGLQDALMSFDFGQLLIDDEIARMLKRVVRGFEFCDEALAADEIRATGPGGMFAAHPDTLARMNHTTFYPQLADRRRREVWLAAAARAIPTRALGRAGAIRTRPATPALDPALDARVRAAFDGLVAGDSVAPEGWTPAPKARCRQRRSNRRRGRG